MIIVTGGAGFIGSNIIARYSETEPVIVVDDMASADKVPNLADCRIFDYYGKREFRDLINRDFDFGTVDAVFHQGACSDTMAEDGRYVMDNNFCYSRELATYCWKRNIPFVYASSASVYGNNMVFSEQPEFEKPLNLYGFSKLAFDQWVRARLNGIDTPTAGLRYFNVYGPREQHKARMASVAFHFHNQMEKTGKIRLFEGSDGYDAGEQVRDFVFVDDVVEVNHHFASADRGSGIFNVGTGRGQTFHEVALTVCNSINRNSGSPAIDLAAAKNSVFEYVPFPGRLKSRYQSYTQADISALRKSGYTANFHSVEEGVENYCRHLNRISREQV